MRDDSLPVVRLLGTKTMLLGGPPAVALLVALACALVLAGPAGASVTPPIESRFDSVDSGLDGWTVLGDPASGYPRHIATGGNPGGFARAADGGRGATMYWSAPGKFLGDKSAYHGGTLGFDLRQSAVDRQFNAVEVELIGAGLRLTLDFSHPQTGWTPYAVPLASSAGWQKGAGVAATEQDLRAALGDLGGLRIRAEYRDGADTDDLDNVVLAGPPDTAPPKLELPGDITGEATSNAGAKVTYAVAATDEDPYNPGVDCSHPSGGIFPLGETTVACSAVDNAGNRAAGTFKVTVRDTTGPNLVVPDGVVIEAQGADGANVDYRASAEDTVDGAVGVSCTPSSGGMFPLGESTVTCSATDRAGNTAAGSFAVTVRDTTAPIISGMPADTTATATGSSGALVDYAPPTASDAVDGTVEVACEPPSGSQFALGGTTVTCSASDGRGNTASETFEVNVVYDFEGFFAPVDNPDVLNLAKAGSAIPVKFSLSGDQGLDVFAAGYPASATARCDSTNPVDAIEQTVTANASGLTYDADTDRYSYVWKTSSGWAGGCRQLAVQLTDGTIHRANFKFK